MNLATLLSEVSAWSPLEISAAVLALFYLVLAARQNIWCWPCAFVSTAIYFYLFQDRQLYQQSLLQVFYLAMAVYGFVSWRKGAGGKSGGGLAITRWPMRRHLQAAGIVLVLTLASGWLEKRYTSAPMPYLDAFTTWGSVITTWMVARKIIENWLYWLIVDSVLVYVYFVSDLPATALLFVIYLGLVIAGYLKWKPYLNRPAHCSTGASGNVGAADR